MKIAYMGVKGLPSKSGTERVIEAIIKRLAGKFDITIYCDADYTPAGTHYEGVKLIRIPSFKGRHLKPIMLGILSALHAFFLGNYDLIHMNGVENCFTLPLLRLRYKVISTSHGTPGRMPLSKWSRIEHFLMQMAEYPFLYLSNYVTAISAMDTEYLHDRYGRNVIYIPNGIDMNMPVDDEASHRELKRLGILPHNYLLFAAGRIIERKGAHILLDAFNSLDLDMPLVIIGDLNQVPEYEKRLKGLADQGRVIFAPPIAEEGLLYGVLKLCKLFIFPSIAEGMSIMFLEAASLGIPLICSDIPENASVLGDRALYFRSGDPVDLANKIRWAIDHPREMVRLKESARDWIRKNYSWDLIASRYGMLYEQCILGWPVPGVDTNTPVKSSVVRNKE
ncbi:MAG: glycosyltransferase family 4 protein [Anaerolineales bacterium]|nr:glycosyltransferase family 4 protein [Anaerolineales bacterium]